MRKTIVWVGAFAMLATLLVAPQAALAGASHGPKDLTHTQAGAEHLANAQAFIDAHEKLTVDMSKYSVVTGVAGDEAAAVWVLPDASKLPTVTLGEDGSFSAIMPAESPEVSTSGGGGGGGHLGMAALTGSLSWQTATCFARYTSTYGWVDRCTQWAQLINDGDSVHDHWVFKTYATCKSNANWLVTSCKLSSSGGTYMTWEDWAPKSDTSGGCRGTSISVSVLGVSASGSYTACDTMNITKSTTPGTFSNAFENSAGVYQSERNIQYQMGLGTQNGYAPVLTTSLSMNGFLKVG